MQWTHFIALNKYNMGIWQLPIRRCSVDLGSRGCADNLSDSSYRNCIQVMLKRICLKCFLPAGWTSWNRWSPLKYKWYRCPGQDKRWGGWYTQTMWTRISEAIYYERNSPGRWPASSWRKTRMNEITRKRHDDLWAAAWKSKCTDFMKFLVN